MPGQLRAVRSGLGGDGVKLEWRTGCGVVTPFDSEEYDHLYEVGDAEDCVECDSPVERPCQATVCEWNARGLEGEVLGATSTGSLPCSGRGA